MALNHRNDVQFFGQHLWHWLWAFCFDLRCKVWAMTSVNTDSQLMQFVIEISNVVRINMELIQIKLAQTPFPIATEHLVTTECDNWRHMLQLWFLENSNLLHNFRAKAKKKRERNSREKKQKTTKTAAAATAAATVIYGLRASRNFYCPI